MQTVSNFIEGQIYAKRESRFRKTDTSMWDFWRNLYDNLHKIKMQLVDKKHGYFQLDLFVEKM